MAKLSITCLDLPQTREMEPIMKVINNQPSINIPLKRDWTKRPTFLIQYFKNYFDKALNFKIRESDVFVMGLPKTGTTWL